jgi:formate dehydrogenase beta subunit
VSLELLRVSATSGPAPGVRVEPQVVKLVDTSTCIGCKACEVACQEWNDLAPEATGQTYSYQTLPETTAGFWNLIKFNEYEDEDAGSLRWLMRKDQCMHCAEPGCLIACPAPGAIVQYTNGIVDFQQDHCIGCGYCITGCPFDVPKFNTDTRRVYKCTLCVDRVTVGLQPACVKACPTSCLQFGTKDAMLEVANTRVAQLQENGFAKAAVYDPAGVGGTGVVTVLAFGDRPELYGLPKDPTVPLAVRIWKGPLKWFGNLAMLGGLAVAAVHFVKYGRKSHERGGAIDEDPHTAAKQATPYRAGEPQ